MKEKNEIYTTISKMREEVSVNEEKINTILGISYLKGNKTRYRKYMRLESYSLISKYRLLQRLEKKSFKLYSFKVMKILEKAFVSEKEMKLVLNSNYVSEMYKSYDVNAIEKYLSISIKYVNNEIIIDSNNELMNCRILCLMLCDMLDLGVEVILFCDEKYINTILQLLKSDIIFDYSYINFYNIKNDYKELCRKCGFLLNNNKVKVEPYRLEVCTFSQVLSDILDISIDWPMMVKKVSKNNTSGYMLLHNIQEKLNANGYCNCELSEESCQNDKKLEDTIIEYEALKRNIKQPHKYFCITRSLEPFKCSSIIIWSCGNKTNINELATTIKNIVIQEFGENIQYNFMGETIIFKNENDIIAKIWLAKEDGDKMKKFNIFNLLISKINIKEKLL